uniref:Proline rich 11 n=1 Tax=Salvator merianae TaxID=96440 RepID=A0A8D0C9V9_SALMN
MAKNKQQRQKMRARVKFLWKKRNCAIQLQPSSDVAPPGRLPVSWWNPRRPFCSWPSAFLSITQAVKPLLIGALGLYSWFQKSFTQIFQVMRSTVFPSHVCLQEMKALREQLDKLQKEFAELQSVVQNGTVVAPSNTPPCRRSGNTDLALAASAQFGLTGGVSLPLVPAPPPPPPPPPLPPPPPPTAPLCFRKTAGVQAQAPTFKKEVPMQITLQDLRNVKLKKTHIGRGIDKKKSPLQRHKVLIELSDLQSIHLKSQALHKRVTNNLISPSKSCLDFRKHLKKVAVDRSPGGTPLTNKENMETGTGLTPIMTKALRRKFQLAHPKSPSPSQLPRGSSFEEQA